MPEIVVDDVELHYADRGTGDVVLLVHGFPLNHSMWNSQIEHLSEQYHVIAPDLRGFGKSSVTEGTVTMGRFARDLVGLLDQLGIESPIHYCGLSMGGYIAWDFLRIAADRLQSLILCDTRAVADTAEGKENRIRLAEKVMNQGPEFAAKAMLPNLFAAETISNKPEVVQAVEQMMLDTDPRGIAAASCGMAERADATDELGGIRVPTLVLVGEHDKISTAEEMKRIADTIPQATFAEISAAGHMAPMEKAEASNGALTSFLNSVG